MVDLSSRVGEREKKGERRKVTLDTEDVQIAQNNECNSTEHKSKQQSTDSYIQLILERTTRATMRVGRLWSFTW